MLLVAAASRWLVADVHPEAAPTLASAALGCGWAALLAFTVLNRQSSATSKPNVLRSLLAGALFLGGPAIGLLINARDLSASALTIALALTPVAVAIAASAFGAARSLGVAGRIWPGLAAATGLLLILVQPDLGNTTSDIALFLAPTLTGLGAALFDSADHPPAANALIGAAALFAFATPGHIVHRRPSSHVLALSNRLRRRPRPAQRPHAQPARRDALVIAVHLAPAPGPGRRHRPRPPAGYHPRGHRSSSAGPGQRLPPRPAGRRTRRHPHAPPLAPDPPSIPPQNARFSTTTRLYTRFNGSLDVHRGRRRRPRLQHLRKRRTLARYESAIEALALSLGVKPLLEFFSADQNSMALLIEEGGGNPGILQQLPPPQWYSPTDGLDSIYALIDALEEDPHQLGSEGPEVLTELREYATVLEKPRSAACVGISP